MNNLGRDAFGLGPTVRTLGTASVITSAQDRDATTIGPGKPLAVLVYLTASPGRSATRDHLIDLLWADAEPEAARHGVRQTVWLLRRKLGADTIAATRDLVHLTADVHTDRGRFLEAIQSQAYDEAVELYGGDFLPNMAMPGGLRFERWAEVERQRLRSLFLRAAESEVRRYLSQARHRDAVALSRRMRNEDQSAEASWRLLIEVLLGTGDHLGATAEAESLARRLAAERIEPEPATRAIIHAAQSSPGGRGTSATSHGLNADLIGRSEEFSVLASAWEDAHAGHAVHVHVAALPGVGKTRLVADFAARLRARRARIAMLSLRQGDQAIPYAALGELAAALALLPGATGISAASARTLVALNPALSTVYDVEPDNSQIHDVALRRTVAMQELIASLSQDVPLALIIDDLHWIDEASQRALASALQRVSDHRLLAVTAARPGPMALRTPATIHLWLRPLTEANVASLVVGLGALPEEPWAEDLVARLHSATDGVPLLVLETLQLLVERRVLRLSDSTWSSPRPDDLEKMLGTRSALADRLRALSASERGVLTVIAAAGTPLPEAMLATLLDMGRGELHAHAVALEHRGLLVTGEEGWRVMHDSIGEVATGLATDDALRKIHGELGAWFFKHASDDSGAWLRASSHFALAADVEAVTRCFVNWLAVARRRGDPRPTRDLAAEFASRQHGLLQPSALAHGAPLHLRISRRRRTVLVAAAVVATASAIAYGVKPSNATEPPDATLYAYSRDSTGHAIAAAIDLRQSQLGRTDVIELQSGRSARPIGLPDPLSAALSPDGRSWASRRSFPDSGGLDVVLTDVGSGAERRITSSPADDYSPSWSPDGKYLVFSTARFSPRGHADLAIVDVHSGVVRQLTNGAASDETPQWHPSGTEIAFARHDWSTGRSRLCVITVDASRLDCGLRESPAALSVRGWYDWRRVVVIEAVPGVADSAVVATVDVENHETRTLVTGRVDGAQLSPDGQWMACRCAPNPQLPARWTVFPLARPDLAREVVADRLGERDLVLAWLGRRRTGGYLAKLSIRAPAAVLPLGVGTSLIATAKDDSEHARPAAPLTWSSLTPNVATIDSVSGLLIPHVAGQARIRVSAGGWISADTTVRIGASDAPLVLVEDWTAGLNVQFVPFGVPAPLVISGTPVGAAMRNNGDGSFSSGVYSRKEFVGSAGLGVEVVVSTPVDSLQWQTLSVELRPGMDSARLARWDHRDSESPGSADRPSVGRCLLGIPGGEGPANAHLVSVLDLRQERRPLAPRYFSGQPYRLRVQLFPDGRCGVAVDGRPLVIVPGRPLADARYRLIIAGNSAQTDILVGPVRMWTGVQPDVPWLQLDLAAAGAASR
ncbi:MAG TPA: AAA family ATPase [Gemmatimonadaceae bacterium]|nr:AAA family ATPase [Gemmatimonadaceae bacterium]